jgi:hypothetical protein
MLSVQGTGKPVNLRQLLQARLACQDGATFAHAASDSGRDSGVMTTAGKDYLYLQLSYTPVSQFRKAIRQPELAFPLRYRIYGHKRAGQIDPRISKEHGGAAANGVIRRDQTADGTLWDAEVVRKVKIAADGMLFPVIGNHPLGEKKVAMLIRPVMTDNAIGAAEPDG